MAIANSRGVKRAPTPSNGAASLPPCPLQGVAGQAAQTPGQFGPLGPLGLGPTSGAGQEEGQGQPHGHRNSQGFDSPAAIIFWISAFSG